MEQQEPIVAVSMLTQRELDAIGHQLNLIYRLDTTTQFDALLAAIDEAEATRTDRSIKPATLLSDVQL
jgi:hypothetical protein